MKYLHNIFYIDDTLKYFRYIEFKMLLKINFHASFYFLKSVHHKSLKPTCGFYHISFFLFNFFLFVVDFVIH